MRIVLLSTKIAKIIYFCRAYKNKVGKQHKSLENKVKEVIE